MNSKVRKQIRDNWHEFVVFTALGLASLTISGCSSAPTKGSLEYIDKQVYQCRMLCANAEVNIAQIEGLNCVCSKPQTPVIYNPIVTGSNGGASHAPAPYMPMPQPQAQPIIINSTANQPPDLTPKDDATRVQDATGRTIISQTR